MMRKVWGIGVVTSIILVLVSPLFPQEMVVSPLVQDLEAMEKILYGVPQSGSVLARVEKVERDLIGDTLSGTLMERTQTLKRFILTGTPEEPSLAFKIRAIRLTLRSEPSSTGILTAELEDLEHLIFGMVSDEPIGVRVDRLYKTCVDPTQVKAFTVKVPPQTLVKIALEKELSSEKSEVGDPVPYKVLEDVQVDGVLVIAKGTRGEGRIIKVRRKGAFGRSGRLQIDFQTVAATDGTPIPLALGEKALHENEALAYAVGASVAGLAILGPIGAVAGVFVQGEPVKIKAGTEFFVEVSEEREVSGPLLGWEPSQELVVPASSQEEPEETWDIEEIHPVEDEEMMSVEEKTLEEEPLGEELPEGQPQVEVEVKPFEDWNGEEGGK